MINWSDDDKMFPDNQDDILSKIISWSNTSEKAEKAFSILYCKTFSYKLLLRPLHKNRRSNKQDDEKHMFAIFCNWIR